MKCLSFSTYNRNPKRESKRRADLRRGNENKSNFGNLLFIAFVVVKRPYNPLLQKKTAMFGVGLPKPSIIFTMVLIVFGAGKLPIAICLSKKIQNFKR